MQVGQGNRCSPKESGPARPKQRTNERKDGRKINERRRFLKRGQEGSLRVSFLPFSAHVPRSISLFNKALLALPCPLSPSRFFSSTCRSLARLCPSVRAFFSPGAHRSITSVSSSSALKSSFPLLSRTVLSLLSSSVRLDRPCSRFPSTLTVHRRVSLAFSLRPASFQASPSLYFVSHVLVSCLCTSLFDRVSPTAVMRQSVERFLLGALSSGGL